MPNKPKIILGIETSCDETACAILQKDKDRITILSNIIGSSADLQAKYGGVIPEQAAREQLKLIIPVIESAIEGSQLTIDNIDAIAVTQGPGLIGSLLIGVETAKTLATVWNKPLIPVNHLIGHFYANWIDDEGMASTALSQEKPSINSSLSEAHRSRSATTLPKFPCLGLLVSGGHTDLVIFKDHGKFEYLGGTRDDAAGECFDKSARLLGYPYPGGPKISKIAQKGDPKVFNLPRPMLDSGDFDFSFSGLKTAFANLVAKEFQVTSIDPKNAQANWKRIVLDEKNLTKSEQTLANLCASIEEAIIGCIVKKTIKAAKLHNIEQIIVAGGVAANQKLISELKRIASSEKLSIHIHVPPPILCTDNATMIASAAFFITPAKSPLALQANPNLSLAY